VKSRQTTDCPTPIFKRPPITSKPVTKLTKAQLRAVYLEAAERIHAGENYYACSAASHAAGVYQDGPEQPQTRLIWETFAPHDTERDGAIWANPFDTKEDQEARILGLLLLREMLRPERRPRCRQK
jgi:hypothetical protein